jgi:hypothetical protein
LLGGTDVDSGTALEMESIVGGYISIYDLTATVPIPKPKPGWDLHG